MRSIIEELYKATMDFDSQNDLNNMAYTKALRICGEREEKLMAELSPNEKELFEKYCESQSKLESIINYNTFSCAFKIGAMLMTEIFMEKNSVWDDK